MDTEERDAIEGELLRYLVETESPDRTVVMELITTIDDDYQEKR